MIECDPCQCDVCAHLRGGHEGETCKMMTHLFVKATWHRDAEMERARWQESQRQLRATRK
jgi:hypothetical protein